MKNKGMKKLNILAPINSLGYGVASKNTVRGLREIFDVSLFTIGNANLESKEEAEEFGSLIQDSKVSFDSNSPCLKIWHEFDMAARIGRGELIAYSFFELDKMNAIKRHNLSQCDKVAVTSEWAKQIVETEVNGANVYVAPLGVDTSTFYPQEQTADNNKFVVFNCGKWELRKGHDIILECFQKAFPDNQDVELWMACHNPIAPEEYNTKWSSFYQQDFRVRLLPSVGTHQELASLMNIVSCGFFPSRAEGWNLELLELMACGKPVITTDYSSHTQFCTENNSIKIKPKELEPALDGFYFKEEGYQWASLDSIKDDFIYALRQLYKQWQTDRELFNRDGVRTAKDFSWDNTAKRLEEAIND